MPGDLPIGLAGSEVLGKGRSGRPGKEVSPAGAQGQGRHHLGLTRGFEEACVSGESSSPLAGIEHIGRAEALGGMCCFPGPSTLLVT